MKKVISFLVLVILVLGLAGCAAGVTPESDSDQMYSGGKIPIDPNVYTIVVTVSSDVENLTQVNGEASSVMINGYGSGSARMWTEGKGFIKVTLESITPELQGIEVGNEYALKTTDQKIMILAPGDRVTLRCRWQYEAVAAMENYEKFDADKVSTWEFDYCRMVTPKIE